MAQSAESRNHDERLALAQYRSTLDTAFAKYGFSDNTLTDIRGSDCLPMLYGVWDIGKRYTEYPKLPTRLAEILNNLTIKDLDLSVAEIGLTHSYAQIRTGYLQMDGAFNPRLFDFGQGDYPDVDIHPWITFDFESREASAQHYGVTGDFPGTYDRTKQVQESLSIVELTDFSKVIGLVAAAPVNRAMSLPTDQRLGR